MRRQLVAFAAVPLAAALGATADLSFSTPSRVAWAFRPARLSAPLTQTSTPPRSSGIELDALDRRIDPCTDFYQFACGGWIAKNPVPSDRRSYGRFTELQDRNFAILRRLLEEPGAESRPGQGRAATGTGATRASSTDDGDRQKAADFYAACMDESRIEASGLTPIAADLATIDEILNPDDLPVLIAHLHSYGIPALFRFAAQTDLENAANAIATVDQDGLGLPDRDYYLKSDARSIELRGRYVALIRTMLGLAGEPADQASSDATAVLSVETTLAAAMLDRVKRRDPASTEHRMTINELQALSPNFNWRKYASAAEAPPLPTINVSVPDYLRALNTLIDAASMSDLKAYLRWHVLHVSADLLPKAYADADFDFFSRTLAGQLQQPPRWHRCVTQTDEHLGEALGPAFVEATFSARTKAETAQMVEAIKEAMRRDIDAAAWMSTETKKAAVLKLDAVVDRIGYPEEWRDYSSIRITRDDALGNRQRTELFNHTRMLAKIGQPVDRAEWAVTPPTVDAYYSPDRNTITIPAGILQPPFYRAGRDPAVNFGAAGAMIGHELTHGFDDQGRKFDAGGNLHDWWTDPDRAAFDQRATCVADQYSGYPVAGDAHVNGRLTLGENTADNGGLRLALMAYLAGPGAKMQGKLDGFTPEQRVFLGWAQTWCESARPEAERLKAATNPHSSNKYRANGPASNMPEFQKAFACQATAPMVRQPACRVW